MLDNGCRVEGGKFPVQPLSLTRLISKWVPTIGSVDSVISRFLLGILIRNFTAKRDQTCFGVTAENTRKAQMKWAFHQPDVHDSSSIAETSDSYSCSSSSCGSGTLIRLCRAELAKRSTCARLGQMESLVSSDYTGRSFGPPRDGLPFAYAINPPNALQHIYI